MSRPVRLGALLAVATIAVYAQVVHHGFVNWDDPEHIAQNPMVAGGLSVRGVVWAFTHYHIAIWHPLTTLSHMLDCELFGLWAGGHHLTSVLLHVVATLLLFGVLSTLTGCTAPSAFVAGVFALHPLRAESVAWVSERKDVLSAVLWMTTMWCWARWVKRPSAGAYAGVLVAYALALLAKPMAVTLPLVLLLLDVWPLERRVPLRRRLVEQLPLVLMALVVSVITLVSVRITGGIPALDELGVGDRVASATVGYAWYVAKTFWPSGLAVFYPLRLPIPLATLSVSAVFVGSVTVIAWGARRTRPWLFVGWFWYLVTLLPVVGLVRVGRQAVADRYSYLPGIGLAIIVAWAGAEIARTHPSTRRAIGTMAVAALVALGVASWVQVGYWRNDAMLYERALAVTQDNFVAHTNYGSALLAQNRVDDALRHYEEALRIDPRAAQAHANVGVALATRGDAAGALAAFDRALALDARDAATHVRAADVLAGEGRLDEAIAHYETAAALEPDSAAVHNNLGFLLAARGRVDEAVAQYRDALRTEPDLATAHNNLALALEALGRRDEALGHYARAVELAPDDPAPRLNHARALLRAGRDAEARAELREALRRRPDAAPAAADLLQALPVAAD